MVNIEFSKKHEKNAEEHTNGHRKIHRHCSYKWFKQKEISYTPKMFLDNDLSAD